MAETKNNNMKSTVFWVSLSTVLITVLTISLFTCCSGVQFSSDDSSSNWERVLKSAVFVKSGESYACEYERFSVTGNNSPYSVSLYYANNDFVEGTLTIDGLSGNLVIGSGVGIKNYTISLTEKNYIVRITCLLGYADFAYEPKE